MASLPHLIFLSLIFISLSLSQAKPSSKPKALLLPVSKDLATLQYITHLSLGTPFVPRSFVVDLGGRFLWMDCETKYNSSTYKPGRCGSAPCSIAKPRDCDRCFSSNPGPVPGCNNNTCVVVDDNSVTKVVALEEVAIDKISLHSTDGSKLGPRVSVSNFIFACSRDWLLKGLAKGVGGMAGLGRTRIGLPTQLSSAFGGSFRRKFALCLPSESKGVIFFGNASSYTFYPSYNESKLIDVSARFSYTRLYINPITTATPFIPGEPSTEPSAEYFIKVSSIRIDKKPIPINSKLLSFDNKGFGGTKISTINPYTVLETSIYKAFTEEFVKQLATVWNVSKVAPMAPFTECFSTERLALTLLGPLVPDIEIVLEGKDVSWGIYGNNSMVSISRDVVCLGFLDGGLNPRTSIVIGALQLEDNLLEFDLAASKLAFTSTLLFDEVRCANFKF